MRVMGNGYIQLSLGRLMNIKAKMENKTVIEWKSFKKDGSIKEHFKINPNGTIENLEVQNANNCK